MKIYSVSHKALLLQSLLAHYSNAFLRPSYQGLVLRNTFGGNAALQQKIQRNGIVRSRSNTSFSLSVSREVEEEEDWRSFRAKLVSSEKVIFDDQFVVDGFESVVEKDSSWIYESGLNIETGTVLLNHPSFDDFNHGLSRQWLHKSVVLILEHESQGHTTGLLLNRPTDLILYDDLGENEKNSNIHNMGWEIWFGGDEFGIHTDYPKFFCLHSMNSNEAKAVSREVIPGIHFCSLQNAKSMVLDGFANFNDFWAFSGFQTWESAELLGEIKNGSWHAISTDANVVRKGLRILNSGARCDGDRSWKILMRLLGQRVKYHQNEFCDRMLKEWSTLKLEFEDIPKFAREEDDSIESSSPADTDIMPGTFVQASETESSHLFEEQYFHRSTILIIQDDEDMTVGVMINMPSSMNVNLPLQNDEPFDEDSVITLPLRFGGPIGGPCYEGYCEGEPLFSLHQSSKLRDAGLGEPIGDEDGVWRCTFEELTDAVRRGEASAEDFAVIDGICVWTKEENDDGSIGGGIAHEIKEGKFEKVPTHRNTMLWESLSALKVLSHKTLEENIGTSINTWKMGNDSVHRPSNRDINSSQDESLRHWMKMFLIGIDDNEQTSP